MKINNALPVVDNKNPNKQNVAFKGDVKKFSEIAKNGFKNLLTLNRQGPMERNLFVINAFTFLLGSRLITSRDGDERREILVRDVPTFVIAVMGVPFFSKLVSKAIQNKAGFAIMETDKNPQKSDFRNWLDDKFPSLKSKELKPRMNSISHDKQKGWYLFDKNLSSGFRGFAQRLVDQGGDFKKICSSFGGEIKKQINAVCSDKNLTKEQFIEELFNSKNNKLIKQLEEVFAKDNNAAMKKASHWKTVPTIAGFALTLSIVGIFIPKFNIFLTEKINTERKVKPETKTVSDNLEENPNPNLLKQYEAK